MNYLILLILHVITPSLCAKCNAWSPSYTSFLSSKTPYRIVESKTSRISNYPQCTPKKFWAMVRHGTRYPGSSLVNRMNDDLVSVRHDILSEVNLKNEIFCDDVVNLFSKWKPGANLRDVKNLAHEGEDEMLGLGERFQKSFPSLFPDIYSSHYQFRSTEKQRAVESMKHFMIGLFNRKTVNSVWPIENATNHNHILRFYKSCPRWRRDVDKNPVSLLEKLKLQSTVEWTDMMRNISGRLGYETSLELDVLHAMYQTCAFETAWSRNYKSPWCAVFTESELAKFEFADDLEHYHIDGYGHPLNYRQACVAVLDMIEHLTSNDGANVSVSFSHSGTILKMLSHFGLYNQVINHEDMDENRLWRIGKIDAFGTNIAFVLYRCGVDDKFLFLHQEVPVRFPGCPAEGLCPISVLLNAHGDRSRCQFDQMCKIPDDSEVH